jgi:alkylation response protein AidB-like acyl-CoA dehydrogenase
MNFDFSPEQHEIKRTARELLARRSSFERVRATTEDGASDQGLWDELRELGWPGIAIGEEHGGQGLGTLELAILLEELGYAVTPVPFLPSAMAALAIEHAGSDEQRERWLPRLASGEITGALGAATSGSGDLVADADRAAVIALVEDGGARLIAREDAQIEPRPTIDPTRPAASVAGDGEPLPGDVHGAIDRATLAVAAELVGTCQRALDMTLAYVKERKQFGVPVGAFQAVQHRCASMLMHTESARSATYFAAWAAGADRERLPEAASMAKAAASTAGREVTASAIQAHGGVGFTWEADVHWLFKRAQMDAALLGGASAHHARLAQLAAARVASPA